MQSSYSDHDDILMTDNEKGLKNMNTKTHLMPHQSVT